ncbi:MAG: CHC2 zinc finger domain-containing protein [Sulfurospirillaceae bacterium]|nr:CHC2 zinc finger domain-containing protein [Sulfurospirillaceae bacterium]MDD2825633.1 CHC2 zinc finger domain-containing protein [Sulfurospirillaceae bacterium]
MKYDTELLNNIPIKEVAQILGIEINKNTKAMCFAGHDTKTPSLSFQYSKNKFKCFGCGIGGGPINLIMEYGGVDFQEACQWLMDRFIHDSSNQCIKKKVFKQDIKKIETNEYQPNAEIYEWIINNTTLSKKAIDYFKARNINEDTLRYFNIRDILLTNEFFNEAKKRWGIDRLVQCGLWINNDQKSRPIWWQDVIVFPFYNHENKINYLQGRFYDHPKIRWMNLSSIESTIFNEQILKDLKVGEKVVITEGLTDALSAKEFGWNVIGIMGASNFKSSYVSILKNYDIYIAPDNDAGGEKFFQSIQRFFSQIKTIKRIQIPKQYNDLNEVIKGRII